MTRRSLVLGVLVACITGATVARAILPGEDRAGEIPVPPGITMPSYRQLDARESSQLLPGWDAFAGSLGSGWMVIQYRDDLQTPATLVGHGITEHTYHPDPPPTWSGMNEGIADMVAQTITGDHYIGQGFRGPGTHIRDGENARQYPGVGCCSTCIHCLGEILMGSMWRTRTNVMNTTGVPGEFSADLPAQPCGTVVSYYLRAVTTIGTKGTWPDQAPRSGVYRFMVGPRVAVHAANYETDQGWTVGAPGDGAIEGMWERVDPVGKADSTAIYQPEDDHTAAPGVLCYVTDGRGGSSPFDYDVDGGATTLLSPVFDPSTTSGACKLDFRAFFMNAVVVDDTLRASVSNDGGTTWLDFWKLSGEGRNAWTNYKAYFSSDQVPFTSQMRFRFQVADDNDSQTEAAIDDVIIRRTTCAPMVNGACCAADGGCTTTSSAACLAPNAWQGDGTTCSPNPCPTTSVPEAPVPLRFAVEAARPNPTGRGTTLRWALPVAGGVGIDLFDAGGRLVRTLARGPMAAGYHRTTWDGSDASGSAAASGVYYCRVRANGQEQTRKILVVR